MHSKALFLLAVPVAAAMGFAQNVPAPAAPPPLPPQTISLPTFASTAAVGDARFTYTLLGNDPAKGGTTTIPTVLVPVAMTIDAPMDATGKKAVFDAGPIASAVVKSPIFAKFPFASGATQYADAMMRADFHKDTGGGDWHTLLGQPTIVPIAVTVPVGNGYVLTSKKTGRMLAMVDLRFMQAEVFKHLPRAAGGPGRLVMFVARDVTYYVNNDATQCCHSGTWGVDSSAGARQPFVLGTYLDPGVVETNSDVQPLSQQLARFFRDPLHDALYRGARGGPVPGNAFPAWMKTPPKSEMELPRQNSAAGGSGIAAGANDPTDVNWKNTPQSSKPFAAALGGTTYHLQNVALLPWYNQSTSPVSLNRAYSFPDPAALPGPATPVPVGRRGGG